MVILRSHHGERDCLHSINLILQITHTHTHIHTHRRNKALAQALASSNSSFLTNLVYGGYTDKMAVVAFTIDPTEGIISFATNKVFEQTLRSARDIMNDFHDRKTLTSLVFPALMAPDDRHLWCVCVYVGGCVRCERDKRKIVGTCSYVCQSPLPPSVCVRIIVD